MASMLFGEDLLMGMELFEPFDFRGTMPQGAADD